MPAIGTTYPFPKPDDEEIIILGMLIFLSIPQILAKLTQFFFLIIIIIIEKDSDLRLMKIQVSFFFIEKDLDLHLMKIQISFFFNFFIYIYIYIFFFFEKNLDLHLMKMQISFFF